MLNLKPANPFGSCFDSAARYMLADWTGYRDVTMCHGIGISNKPGEEGEKIAHAWIEVWSRDTGTLAIDPIWMVAQPAALYRKNLKVEYAITYPRKKFIKMWIKKEFPGPFDNKIKRYTLEGKNEWKILGVESGEDVKRSKQR